MSLVEIIALIEPLDAGEKRRVLNIVRIAIDTIVEEKAGNPRLIRSAQIAVSQSEADRMAAKIKQNINEAEQFLAIWKDVEEKAKQHDFEEKAAAEKAEAERLEKERLDAEKAVASARLVKERLDAERLEAERLEAIRINTEKAEAAKLVAEHREVEQTEAEAEQFEKEFQEIIQKADDLIKKKRQLEVTDINNEPPQKKQANNTTITRPRNYIRHYTRYRSDVFYTFWKMYDKNSHFQYKLDNEDKPIGWFESKTGDKHITYFKIKPEYDHTHQYNSKTKEWIHYYEKDMRIISNADMYALLCKFDHPRF